MHTLTLLHFFLHVKEVDKLRADLLLKKIYLENYPIAVVWLNSVNSINHY